MLLGWSDLVAARPQLRGTPPFGAGIAVGAGVVKVGATLQIRPSVEVDGRHGKWCRISVALPGFLRVLSGDTVVTALGGGSFTTWLIEATPIRSGEGEMVVRMVVEADSANRFYVCEAAAPIRVQGDTGGVGDSRSIRAEYWKQAHS